MTKISRYERRYSIGFKQRVVRELEERGCTKASLKRKYGIKGGSTLQDWIRKFGKNHLLNQVIRIETMEEKDRVRELEAEIKRLKLALADSLLAQRSLEVVIQEANKEYRTDLKKNFGDTASKDSDRKST